MKDPLLFETQNTAENAFSRLSKIIAILRGPDGCPWDREQTIQSLCPQLLEESYEVHDALEEKDMDNVREELGDVYLVLTMMSQILEEEEEITKAAILNEVCEKLIRRHPHVFSDTTASTPDEVIELWDSIKEKAEGKIKSTSTLAAVKRSLPPLERAFKLQKKAAKAGFDWSNSHDVWKKIQEEHNELLEAIENQDILNTEEEMGDFLFSAINLCRFLNIDPSIALHKANSKFIRRFAFVESRMKEQQLPLSAENMEEMEACWKLSKVEKK
jgi:tetrapyrrole methylase family protein / MazG family protein